MYDNAYRHTLVNKDYGTKLMDEYVEYQQETDALEREE